MNIKTKESRKKIIKNITCIILLVLVFIAVIFVEDIGKSNAPDEKAANNLSDKPDTDNVIGNSENTIDAIESITVENEDGNTDSNLDNADDSLNDGNNNVTDAGNEVIKPETSLSIIMVGDVLLHTPLSESGLMEDGSYNYDHFFANIRDDISGIDLKIANQEVILGGRELGLSGYPAFNGAFEVGDALVKCGFNTILHATNHALDKGKNGITSCLNYWKTNYPEINVIGINESQEEQDSIHYFEKNGIKIAILNYTYGTNGIPMPGDMPFAVNMLSEERIAKDVAQAKTEADFIIVCPHWGIEYRHDVTNEQKRLAEYMANLGVDLIIGTHPHYIEPVDWIERADGKRTLVYYSLGNFINATSDWGAGVGDRMVGGMAYVNIKKDDNGTGISEAGVVPLVTQMVPNSGKSTTYLLSRYSQELAEQNEIVTRDGAFSYDYCKSLCENVFGEFIMESVPVNN